MFSRQSAQFSLTTMFLLISSIGLFIVAAKWLTASSWLPTIAIATLVGPLVAWLAVCCLRPYSSRAPIIYLATAIFTSAVALALFLQSSVALFMFASFVIVVWLPQLVWVAFFEWCKWEARVANRNPETASGVAPLLHSPFGESPAERPGEGERG